MDEGAKKLITWALKQDDTCKKRCCEDGGARYFLEDPSREVRRAALEHVDGIDSEVFDEYLGTEAGSLSLNPTLTREQRQELLGRKGMHLRRNPSISFDEADALGWRSVHAETLKNVNWTACELQEAVAIVDGLTDGDQVVRRHQVDALCGAAGWSEREREQAISRQEAGFLGHGRWVGEGLRKILYEASRKVEEPSRYWAWVLENPQTTGDEVAKSWGVIARATYLQKKFMTHPNLSAELRDLVRRSPMYSDGPAILELASREDLTEAEIRAMWDMHEGSIGFTSVNMQRRLMRNEQWPLDLIVMSPAKNLWLGWFLWEAGRKVVANLDGANLDMALAMLPGWESSLKDLVATVSCIDA